MTTAGQHKPGVFKQSNKAHKHGVHRSQRALERVAAGRVTAKATSRHVKKPSKKGRKATADYTKKTKRLETAERKRTAGVAGAAPRLVAVVPLSGDIRADDLIIRLVAEHEADSSDRLTHCHVAKQRYTFSFLSLSGSDVAAALNTVPSADSVVFLLSPHRLMDAAGELMLKSLLAHGAPSASFVVLDLSQLQLKPARLTELKKRAEAEVSEHLPGSRVHQLDSDSHTALFLYHLQQQKLQHQRAERANLLAERVLFEGDLLGKLQVTGYVRGGRALSANQLVHLPGWGDYQISAVLSAPETAVRQKHSRSGEREMREEVVVLDTPDLKSQEDLVAENVPDPLDAEQTWPTAEDEQQAAEMRVEERAVRRVKVPAGTSEYQAAWIRDEGEDDDEDDDGDESDEVSSAEEMSDEDSELEEHLSAMEVCSTAGGGSEVSEDAQYKPEEDPELERFRRQREDNQFPDERDTPMDVSAKERYQMYRGLRSYRSSPWHPQENLPSDYGRIFQFDNFTRTKRRVLASLPDNGVLPGTYVTVEIAGVPRDCYDAISAGEQLVLHQLHSHEQRISVCNAVIKRCADNEEVVANKDELVLLVGFRWLRASCVFSQHTTGDKFKLDRFLGSGHTVCSFYSPLTFPPASVLAFTQAGHRLTLLASGHLLSVDPGRVIVKRVVLSGHPFKIEKRHAVVRYMFFNREDILWFKPIQLRTKLGRHGHITEALGTHGHMKCIFDGPLNSMDTVLMSLYKRVYPRWQFSYTRPAHVMAALPAIEDTVA